MSVVEQICIVRAIKNNGSDFTLKLEPKKEKCANCDGKCVKMMKPAELIELNTKLPNLQINQEVLIYMDKASLRLMVFVVLGLPLLLLMSIIALGAAFNIPEYILVILVLTSLILFFILQVKYLKLKNHIKVSTVL